MFEIWNKIVSLYNDNYNEEEYKLQDLWMKIFEQYFHYNSLDDEIISKKTIHLGSTDRIIPDIVLSKDKKDFAIIELKKSCLPYDEKYKEQLFSYLKQLKVTIGILITNKIELFLYDYEKSDNEQKSIEIDFIKDNNLGEKLIELLDKNKLDIEQIRDFAESNSKIKEDLLKIKELTNEDFVKDILLDYYKKNGFNELSVDNYINSIHINIKYKKDDNKEIKQTANIRTVTVSSYGKTNIDNVKNFSSFSLDRNEAIRLCYNHNIDLSGFITFANLSSSNGKYPANVKLSCLYSDWIILLNDSYRKKLHILKIPANTFTQNDFYIRTDKNLIVLGIDNNFVDSHPQQNKLNRFFEYKIATIDYSEDEK